MSLPPVLFDTSVYIDVLRGKDDAALRFRQLAAGAAVWLSAVVLEELHAGASGKSVRAVERLGRDFLRAGRVLVPNLTDWERAGKTLARLAAKYDCERIGRSRLTNDVLIAASAGRVGVTVMTVNVGDFARLAEFLPFRWRVVEGG
jgi:predicted nucleic acid-binding protein